MVERCVRDAEVAGSNPVNPTISNTGQELCSWPFFVLEAQPRLGVDEAQSGSHGLLRSTMMGIAIGRHHGACSEQFAPEGLVGRIHPDHRHHVFCVRSRARAEHRHVGLRGAPGRHGNVRRPVDGGFLCVCRRLSHCRGACYRHARSSHDYGCGICCVGGGRSAAGGHSRRCIPCSRSPFAGRGLCVCHDCRGNGGGGHAAPGAYGGGHQLLRAGAGARYVGRSCFCLISHRDGPSGEPVLRAGSGRGRDHGAGGGVRV